jgi:hypothetical protein
MKKYLVGFFYSLPIQLVFLHFRRYQVLLIFWYILFSTVNGSFLKNYGAYSLYLAPEYIGKVNAISTSMVGASIGIFIMSWNITTFILHAKHLRFLATTANPFLKYCINNAVIPFIFLMFYFFRAIEFNRFQQLTSMPDLLMLIGGFLLGLFGSILVGFIYFFGADKSIYRSMAKVIVPANQHYAKVSKNNPLPREKGDFRVDWFLSANFKLRKPRDVRHYSKEFLESIFNRHHFAAAISIFVAILFLMTMGFFLDNKFFQIPAGASSTILFAILIAIAGALSFFLGNWTFLVLVSLYTLFNWLIEKEIIDTRNKAYGLNYTNEDRRPFYTREKIEELASDSNATVDKKAFTKILERWKARQGTDKPVMYIVNVSGGGNRSAVFTMNVLQQLDKITDGNFIKQTMLITGASGGMLGAAYFRELYLRSQYDASINLQNKAYVEDISKDLLNPLFSSFIARDITAPAQRFKVGNYTYIKDRGYAFEEKFNENTRGYLNKSLKDYVQPEEQAIIPFMFFNSVISRDGRRMFISSHPARFMMKPHVDSSIKAGSDPDMLDYTSFFKELSPEGIRILSALRMNATFPYVLPNVWLPSYPVIDVMDAGLRDNFGTETSLRFIENFKDWLKANTSKVVLVQIRDRRLGDWEQPDEKVTVLTWLTKPMLLLQNNWFKLQDYYQADELGYAATTLTNFSRIMFQYVPLKKEASASLSFHLTTVEKNDIAAALNDSINKASFKKIEQLRKPELRNGLQQFKASSY